MITNPAQKTLTGRVAIVTGASRGIGCGIAQRLGSAGAVVVVTSRSLETSRDGLTGTLQETVALIEGAGGRAVAIACDLESAESRAQLIDETIARTGRIDILVNNAGRAIHEKLDTFTPDKALAQVQQYLLAPFDLTRLVLPHMRRQGAGWIVNLGSSSATPEDPPYNDYSTHGGASLYTALKAAVHRLTPSHAAELLADNISVNTVAPTGAVMTPGLDALGTIKPGMEGYLEPVEHIAEATLALVEPEPRMLTGQLAFSYLYLDQIGRPTWSLDGRTVLTARTGTG